MAHSDMGIGSWVASESGLIGRGVRNGGTKRSAFLTLSLIGRLAESSCTETSLSTSSETCAD